MGKDQNRKVAIQWFVKKHRDRTMRKAGRRGGKGGGTSVIRVLKKGETMKT